MQGILSCAVAVLLLAAALANHHGHDHANDHAHDHAHDHANHQHHNEQDMTCRKLAPSNADFAFALYNNLKGKTEAGKNIFFSPVGITSALSMLSAGAANETHRQLFSTLGYSTHSQALVDDSYKHLFKVLKHSQEEQQLNIGNIAAVRSAFSLLEKFRNDIRGSYNAEISAVDFNDPTGAAAEINSKIASKTQDKIRDMVKDLDPATAMVLINYVYFRGQWQKPFNSNLTKRANFHVAENNIVQVDMMKRTGRYDCYQDFENNVTVVLLPYKGNTTMMVVLPEVDNMEEVEGFINKDQLKKWHDSVCKVSLDLYMPKFSISAEASLDTTLKEMGIVKAFSNNAEFSGISRGVELKLTKAAHKAVLSVDERGTEAAATTTLEMMPMSMPDVVTLNRPFLVFILEHLTKSILFMGKVNDPTAM